MTEALKLTISRTYDSDEYFPKNHPAISHQGQSGQTRGAGNFLLWVHLKNNDFVMDNLANNSPYYMRVTSQSYRI